MRAGIVVNVTPEDRHRLEAIAAGRSSAQKHVRRAQIILAAVDGCGTFEVMRRSGKAKPVIWRWQERSMQEGVDGVLRDKTRLRGNERGGGCPRAMISALSQNACLSASAGPTNSSR